VLRANIADKTGRKLKWDGGKEHFVDDAQADTFLEREYRKPWHL
jgi:GFO/IDH/MocA oxidoreductase family protein